MTRFKISLGIIAVLIASSIFSGIWINGRCKSLMELSDRAEQFFYEGDKEQAVEETRRLSSEWEKFRKTASVLIPNNKISEIDRLCARIVDLAENDSDELPAELTETEHLLDLLRKSITPSPTTIF